MRQNTFRQLNSQGQGNHSIDSHQRPHGPVFGCQTTSHLPPLEQQACQPPQKGNFCLFTRMLTSPP